LEFRLYGLAFSLGEIASLHRVRIGPVVQCSGLKKENKKVLKRGKSTSACPLPQDALSNKKKSTSACPLPQDADRSPSDNALALCCPGRTLLSVREAGEGGSGVGGGWGDGRCMEGVAGGEAGEVKKGKVVGGRDGGGVREGSGRRGG
jgi:hypothetical protein